MTRREFQSLGSGSATPTPYHYGQQKLRREFKPLPGGVANAPCEKINFKVFDFATGDLLWQKRVTRQLVGTDGDIWDEVYTEVSGVLAGGFITFDATVSLPNRSASPGVFYKMAYARYDAVDGSLLNTPALFSTAASISSDTRPLGNMRASVLRVNEYGKMAGNYTSPEYFIGVVDPATTATEVTYILNRMPFKSTTNLILEMNSTGSPSAYSAATIGVTDSMATMETAITSAFGANVTSVTATGNTLATGPVTLVIDWADNQHYLDQFTVDYASGIITTSRDGNAHLYDLLTGFSSTYANTGGFSSSYQGDACWQASGNLFRTGADPSNATRKRVESWDTSTTPWTLDWSEYPIDGKTAIDTDLPMFFIYMFSNNGICGVTFPYTADDSDLLVNRMSVMTWNDDGTGQESYPNAGSNFTGYYPANIAVEDGGDDLMCINNHWRDAQLNDDGYSSFTQSVYGSEQGRSGVKFSSGSGYSVSDRICIGDYLNSMIPGLFAGFNASNVVCLFTTSSVVPIPDGLTGIASDAASGLTGYRATIENSGILNDSLVEIQRNRLHYNMLSRPGSLEDADTEWRLRWKLNPGATEETTSWFSQTTDLTTLNAELLATFGSDANSEQNVLAAVSAMPSPVDVPLYKRDLYIEAISARNTTDATTMGTPAFFITPGSTAITALGRMPFLYLDLQSFGKAQPKHIASLKLSDGTYDWARNWNLTGSPKPISRGVLYGGSLYVAGVLSCIETYAGLTIETVETTTPPYAVTGGTATFDVTFRNLTGVALSSLTLTASHDGGGSLSSPTMPTTMAVGASSTVALTYTTAGDIVDVSLSIYVTGTKPDTTTIDSATVVEIVVVDPLLSEPPADPPP